MALLTIEQVEKLEVLTGNQNNFSTLVRTQLTSELTQITIDTVVDILEQLDEVDTLLKEARSLSFVTESKGSKLNYISQVNHLKSEGTRLLKELVMLLSIELRYNKYNPVTAYSRPSKSTVSYW